MKKDSNLNQQKQNRVFFDTNMITGCITAILPLIFIAYIFWKSNFLSGAESIGYGYLLIFITPIILFFCLVFLAIFSLIRKTIKTIIAAIISFIIGIMLIFIVGYLSDIIYEKLQSMALKKQAIIDAPIKAKIIEYANRKYGKNTGYKFEVESFYRDEKYYTFEISVINNSRLTGISQCILISPLNLENMDKSYYERYNEIKMYEEFENDLYSFINKYEKDNKISEKLKLEIEVSSLLTNSDINFFDKYINYKDILNNKNNITFEVNVKLTNNMTKKDDAILYELFSLFEYIRTLTDSNFNFTIIICRSEDDSFETFSMNLSNIQNLNIKTFLDFKNQLNKNL